jgi:hypothetical protein
MSWLRILKKLEKLFLLDNKFEVKNGGLNSVLKVIEKNKINDTGY